MIDLLKKDEHKDMWTIYRSRL